MILLMTYNISERMHFIGGYLPNVCYNFDTVEGGELGRWCELGHNFSDSSPLLLLVKGHWCAILRKCSAL